jgi:hypothetical protein
MAGATNMTGSYPCVLIALLLSCTELSAKGGSFHAEDRYNPQHIEALPSEIRDSILRQCRDPRALHSFAGYSDGLQRITLHYEHLICGNDGAHCGSGGCRHEVWVLAHGHYRLLRSYEAPEGE